MGSWLKGNIELLLPILFLTPMGGILAVKAKWGLLHAATAWVPNGDLITQSYIFNPLQPFPGEHYIFPWVGVRAFPFSTLFFTVPRPVLPTTDYFEMLKYSYLCTLGNKNSVYDYLRNRICEFHAQKM